MKNKIFKVFLVLGAILFIMPFTSCDTNSTNDESNSNLNAQSIFESNSTHDSNSSINHKNNDTEMYDKIILEYVKQFLIERFPEATIDDVVIEEKYGVYNEAYPLLITNSFEEHLTEETYENVLNYVFTYPTNNHIIVFYSNQFYDLNNAVNNGILNEQDIEKIYNWFNSNSNKTEIIINCEIGNFYNLSAAYNQNIITKDDIKKLYDVIENKKFDSVLDINIEYKIKSDWLFYLKEKIKDDTLNATIDDVTIKNYYGIYSDCYIIEIVDSLTDYGQAISTTIIEGYEFSYTGCGYMIWKGK